MKQKGMSELTTQMIEDVEKIRKGFEMGSRVGVTQLGRSTQWREDLDRLIAMEVVDRNQTAAVIMKPEAFTALMTYIDSMDKELEQAQVEALFGHRKHTTEYLDGGSEELATKAIASFRKRKDQFREILDGDNR